MDKALFSGAVNSKFVSYDCRICTGNLNEVCLEDFALATGAALTWEWHDNKSYNKIKPKPWTFDELTEVIS